MLFVANVVAIVIIVIITFIIVCLAKFAKFDWSGTENFFLNFIIILLPLLLIFHLPFFKFRMLMLEKAVIMLF